MQNKKGNTAVIAIILMIVVITVGVSGWMFAKKSQAPVPKVTLPQQTVPVAQTQPIVQPTTQPAVQPKQDSTPEEVRVKADSVVCQSYSGVLSKYGNIKYDTLNSEGVILSSKGTVCSIAVEKDTYSPNKENEIDNVITALSKDGWEEDLSMKRDIGAMGNYNSIYGFRKDTGILVLEFNVVSPQAQVNKCIAITDSNLSASCSTKILRTEKITIMVGKQQ